MSVPYCVDATVTVHHQPEDGFSVLAGLPDASVDAVVTDPPYGLEFMGKEWDGADGFRRTLNPNDVDRDNAFGRTSRTSPEYRAGALFQSWCELWAHECLRVLKPGGHLLAFGGTRTWHRLACAVEDAGFEVRDSIAWMYGSGFPKSMNVAKAITGTQLGHGGNSGAIRRATMGDEYEPSGVRGNRDGVTRRSDTGMADRDLALTSDAEPWMGWGTALKPAFEPIVVARKPLAGTVAANVLAHGTGALNVDGCRVAHASEADLRESANKNRHADFGSGPRENKVYGADNRDRGEGGNYDGTKGRWPANVVLDESQAAELDAQSGESQSRVGKPRGADAGDGWGMTATGTEYDDLGGASRFFYTAKAGADERVRVGGVAHPTVKPLALMRWLVRLVTPPGGTVLEPFAGSGTTVEACILEGFKCIAIEREGDYLPLIRQRINRRRDPVAAVRATEGDAGLFDLFEEETA